MSVTSNIRVVFICVAIDFKKLWQKRIVGILTTLRSKIHSHVSCILLVTTIKTKTITTFPTHSMLCFTLYKILPKKITYFWNTPIIIYNPRERRLTAASPSPNSPIRHILVTGLGKTRSMMLRVKSLGSEFMKPLKLRHTQQTHTCTYTRHVQKKNYILIQRPYCLFTAL